MVKVYEVWVDENGNTWSVNGDKVRSFFSRKNAEDYANKLKSSSSYFNVWVEEDEIYD